MTRFQFCLMLAHFNVVLAYLADDGLPANAHLGLAVFWALLATLELANERLAANR